MRRILLAAVVFLVEEAVAVVVVLGELEVSLVAARPPVVAVDEPLGRDDMQRPLRLERVVHLARAESGRHQVGRVHLLLSCTFALVCISHFASATAAVAVRASRLVIVIVMIVVVVVRSLVGGGGGGGDDQVLVDARAQRASHQVASLLAQIVLGRGAHRHHAAECYDHVGEHSRLDRGQHLLHVGQVRLVDLADATAAAAAAAAGCVRVDSRLVDVVVLVVNAHENVLQVDEVVVIVDLLLLIYWLVFACVTGVVAVASRRAVAVAVVGQLVVGICC